MPSQVTLRRALQLLTLILAFNPTASSAAPAEPGLTQKGGALANVDDSRVLRQMGIRVDLVEYIVTKDASHPQRLIDGGAFRFKTDSVTAQGFFERPTLECRYIELHWNQNGPIPSACKRIVRKICADKRATDAVLSAAQDKHQSKPAQLIHQHDVFVVDPNTGQITVFGEEPWGDRLIKRQAI